MIDKDILESMFLVTSQTFLASFVVSTALIYVSHIVYSALDLFTTLTK